ncbi:hypothetical protein FRC10_009696 [Ceratobasidium sp. 414]|nr:hypothetical protein FRC10_009696 [Ceratobasidium sp. 414]
MAPSGTNGLDVKQDIAVTGGGEAGSEGHSNRKYGTQDFEWKAVDMSACRGIVEQSLEHSARVMHLAFYKCDRVDRYLRALLGSDAMQN